MGISASSYKLVYFDARGKGEVARLVFAAAGVKYEDYRYPISKTFERPEFNADKEAGKFPFGQIPVLHVDGKIIPQSHAIERYLARRFGMFGDDEIQAALIDALCEQALDIKQKYMDAKKESPAKVEEYWSTTFAALLKGVEAFAAKNAADGFGGYLVGNRLSLADIHFYYLLRDFYDAKDKVNAVLDTLPNLRKAVDKTACHSGIARWVKTRPDNWI
eukprot:tig00021038_g17538.t1